MKGGAFSLEFLALSVSTASNKFCICGFYRPASSPVSIFDHLCITLQMINPAYLSTFLLLGDFNVDFCNSKHDMFSHLNNLLCNFSLTQVVPSFIHVSPNGHKSLIDLALLADVSQLLNRSTIPAL